jgi:type VI secretion system protein ImpK
MRLTDCFMELMAYVVYFTKSGAMKQPPYAQVKADVQRLLGKSEEYLKKSSFSPEEYDQARFMICAWTDEMILASPWQNKDLWQREQLQRIFYNTTEAGEEVFERLNGITYEQKSVREVYYLCLSLGFKGRFIHPEDEYLLEQLKASNLKLLMGASGGIPSLDRTDLFPESFPAGSVAMESKKRRFQFSIVHTVALGGPVFFFALLYLVYRFSLDGLAENFLRTVP